MKKVAIIMVIVGVSVFFKMRNQGDNSAQILSDMKEIISSLDVYQANAEYLDQILETRHMKSFRDAYDMGGRRACDATRGIPRRRMTADGTAEPTSV